jgi:hypothetical protein
MRANSYSEDADERTVLLFEEKTWGTDNFLETKANGWRNAFTFNLQN